MNQYLKITLVSVISLVLSLGGYQLFFDEAGPRLFNSTKLSDKDKSPATQLDTMKAPRLQLDKEAPGNPTIETGPVAILDERMKNMQKELERLKKESKAKDDEIRRLFATNDRPKPSPPIENKSVTTSPDIYEQPNLSPPNPEENPKSNSPEIGTNANEKPPEAKTELASPNGQASTETDKTGNTEVPPVVKKEKVMLRIRNDVGKVVNLRKNPTMTSDKVGEVAIGKEFEIISTKTFNEKVKLKGVDDVENTWYQIKYNGKAVWVLKYYTSKRDE